MGVADREIVSFWSLADSNKKVSCSLEEGEKTSWTKFSFFAFGCLHPYLHSQHPVYQSNAGYQLCILKWRKSSVPSPFPPTYLTDYQQTNKPKVKRWRQKTGKHRTRAYARGKRVKTKGESVCLPPTSFICGTAAHVDNDSLDIRNFEKAQNLIIQEHQIT